MSKLQEFTARFREIRPVAPGAGDRSTYALTSDQVKGKNIYLDAGNYTTDQLRKIADLIDATLLANMEVGVGILMLWKNHLGNDCLWVSIRSNQASRYPGLYQVPGGGADEGEDPLVAAVRETKEETGLELPASRFTQVHASIQPCPYVGKYRQFTFLLVLGEEEVPQHIEKDKHTQWLPVPISKLLKFDQGIMPSTKAILKHLTGIYLLPGKEFNPAPVEKVFQC